MCLTCKVEFHEYETEREIQHRITLWDVIGKNKADVTIDHMVIAEFEGENAYIDAENFTKQIREVFLNNGVKPAIPVMK